MGEYIGVRNLCSLCVHGKIKNKDKYGELNPEAIVCSNENSSFYNCATTGILCAPCFTQKKLKEDTMVEYVGFD